MVHWSVVGKYVPVSCMTFFVCGDLRLYVSELVGGFCASTERLDVCYFC